MHKQLTMIVNIKLKTDPEIGQTPYGSLIVRLGDYVAFYECAKALLYLRKGDKVRIVFKIKNNVKIIKGFYKKK